VKKGGRKMSVGHFYFAKKKASEEKLERFWFGTVNARIYEDTRMRGRRYVWKMLALKHPLYK
jgi:hypothetical protein